MKTHDRELKARIQRRVAELRDIVGMVTTILKKHGKLTSTVHDNHTSQEGDLSLMCGRHKLDTLLLHLDMGHTMFGGNDVRICWNSACVFEVYWQVMMEEAEVRMFLASTNDRPWKRHLKKIYQNSQKPTPVKVAKVTDPALLKQANSLGLKTAI